MLSFLHTADGPAALSLPSCSARSWDWLLHAGAPSRGRKLQHLGGRSTDSPSVGTSRVFLLLSGAEPPPAGRVEATAGSPSGSHCLSPCRVCGAVDSLQHGQGRGAMDKPDAAFWGDTTLESKRRRGLAPPSPCPHSLGAKRDSPRFCPDRSLSRAMRHRWQRLTPLSLSCAASTCRS